jgi:MFS family permease
VPEFRRLWLADVQSSIGDQLSRVALSLLVYDRTKSGLATAAIYALTFLPALFGGILLGGVGDRWPRRRVLVSCDASRAILVALMAIPILPIPVLAVLLAIAVLIGSAFKASESALVVDMLDADAYASGVGVRTVTGQVSQLVGFAAGGILVAAIGTHTALAVDAVTFALSALLIQYGIKARPAPLSAHTRQSEGGAVGHIVHSIRRVFAEPMLRNLLGLAWLAGFYVIPEGLVAPYADARGSGAVAVGLMLAASPAGVALGTIVLLRFSSERRSSWVGPLALAVGLPLIGAVASPPVPVLIVLLSVSGALSAYQVQVIAEFVPAIPPGLRGQAIGVASSGLLAVQGIGLLLGGVMAQLTSASTAIMIAGVVCAVVGGSFAVARERIRRADWSASSSVAARPSSMNRGNHRKST